MVSITNAPSTQSKGNIATTQQMFSNLCYQQIINSSSDWIFVKDRNFRYVIVNQSYAAALGKAIDSIIGCDDIEAGVVDSLVFEASSEGSIDFSQDDITALEGKAVQARRQAITTVDGETRCFEIQRTPLCDEKGEVFACLGIARDIGALGWLKSKLEQTLARETELQRQSQLKKDELETAIADLRLAQSNLVQSEKMSALGEMVAGIAHEINNPVNFIHGNLRHLDEYTQDLLQLIEAYQGYYPEPPELLQDMIDDIDLPFLVEDIQKLVVSTKNGSDRIKNIVKSLRNFSRLDESEFKAADIHAGIESTLVILQHRLKSASNNQPIAIERDYVSLPLVKCYAGQLNQVFMNLLANAIDALEPNDSETDASVSDMSKAKPSKQKTIRIWTEHIAAAQLEDERILIHIADNGPGIPEDVRSRIFNPFFTTKPVGKGTGMGLSISYQIVTQKHGGKLYCNSTVEEGTEFVIELPLEPKPASIET